jgi:phosphohistidine phosphatase
MRHGPAEDHADSGMDSDRALTASGRERVRNVAKYLLELDELPLVIFTSPLVRAVQTAEVVAVMTRRRGEREGASVQVRRELSPGSSGGGALVSTLMNRAGKRVMLVGHEPDLAELVSALVSKEAGRSFEKAMVVGLHIDERSDASRVRFVLDPRALKLEPDLRQAG